LMPIQIGQRPGHDFNQPLGLLSDCHRRIEMFLDVLMTQARRASTEPLSAPEKAELLAAVDYFTEAAPRHNDDEERSLFPRLRRCADAEAARTLEPVASLEADHQYATRHHAAVDTLVRHWIAEGRLDLAATHVLRDHLTILRDVYEQHIAFEDNE